MHTLDYLEGFPGRQWVWIVVPSKSQGMAAAGVKLDVLNKNIDLTCTRIIILQL